MASAEPTLEPMVLDEQEYNSASDEDFDPSAAAGPDDNVSSSEDEARPGENSVRKKAGPRKAKDAERGSDVDFDNSGDEGIISKGKKKAKRKGVSFADNEDEGGEGGLIKTRAQRRNEKSEKKALASTEGSTVDIEKLWAWMNAAPVGTRAAPPPLPSDLQKALGREDVEPAKALEAKSLQVQAAPISVDEEMITVTRTYTFAGTTTTETKSVPKSSAEGQLWLSEQASKPKSPENQQEVGLTKTNLPLRRPLLRKSMFDDDAPSAANLILGPATARKQAERKAGKLTTVEKSKLDWAGYVDREGIGEELSDAKKGKEGYMSRMDFLGRVEDRRENEKRAAKPS